MARSWSIWRRNQGQNLHGGSNWLNRFSCGVAYWLLYENFFNFWHHSPPSTVKLQWDTTHWFCPENMKVFTGFWKQSMEESTLISHSRVSLPCKWPAQFQNENKYGSNLSCLECLPDLHFFPATIKHLFVLCPPGWLYWWSNILGITNAYS